MKPFCALVFVLFCALALLASPASAEVLYDREGIQLQGTARIVSRNAATCNVLEEKYSPEEYEKLKANQGRPLHVWQLDMSVHNNTGKPLDFLSADFNIESPWPPCTNWSGEGPGGGPSGDFVDAEGHPKRLTWADTLKVLSMPYGMRVGQVERDTLFLAVFHRDKPVFKNWEVYFTFPGQGSRGRQAPAAAPSRAAPRQRVELPPRILADKYLRQAEHLVQEKDYGGPGRPWRSSWPCSRSMAWNPIRRTISATPGSGRRRGPPSGPWRRRCASCRSGAGRPSITRSPWT